ncbi:23S rRNA pseudouridine(1911/1915/1917) synthase RluD [Alkalilimnicola sp. S0819]|uniref:23S rRNA pseudouridine(1911/1915/1917) synthase RluD n=1 Tax=Alkalilimnicola sp. S0819 TaxID=2613922 RepID=UPI0012618015|nr:23S rRNA pseudouridine(1911/1915/1917) synthase RluD [Alkalilimnicola sp. S0819]KAB7623802.1 23S rRNA pseudouridine(1911/1915/1917) synthase RluD [Alkalilimnicola sp. S0819]MPQ16676.1 23S rRNA pseudouridine(1911/1915/1917) synthase RluD [Alkalilimnicola sp. S0819]
MAEPVERAVQIPFEAVGRRIDQVLAELIPDFSRSRLQQWLKEGRVSVDGRQLKPRDKVLGGEQVRLRAELESETRVEAEAIPLDVVHQDEALLVVHKPAGLVVHPGAGNPSGTLQNALLHHDSELAAVPRCGIVHRLDKDTSGLMVVARTLTAHKRLVEQLQARTVSRRYLALLNGTLVAGGTVDAPLGRHPRDRKRMAVVGGGREAITHYRVRERFAAHTLVECRLETGRTHQIRVHMAHLRHPLLGDPVYGGRPMLPRGASEAQRRAIQCFGRQALHAWSLGLEHPLDGEPMSWEVPLAEDMQHLLAALRGELDEQP